MFTCVEESVVATGVTGGCVWVSSTPHSLEQQGLFFFFFRVAPTLAFYLLVDLFSLVCSSLV